MVEPLRQIPGPAELLRLALRVAPGHVETHAVAENAVIGSLDRYPGALGLWFGRAADGSWMFVQDRSTQEVYQLSMELP